MSNQSSASSYAVRASRSARILYAQRAIAAATNFAQMVALARLLSPRDYGIALIVILFTNYVTVLRDLGLSASAIQASELSDSQQSSLFWLNAAATLIIAAALVTAAPSFSAFYHEPSVEPMLVVAATAFLVAGIGAQHAASLKREINFWKVAVAETVGLLLGFTLTIGAVLCGWGPWSPIMGLVLQNTVTTIGYLAFAPWLPGRPAQFRNVFHLLKFGANTSLFNILNYSAYNLPTLIIGYLFGSAETALFSRAQNLFMFPMTFLIIPALQVLYPLLCRIRGDGGQTRVVYMRMLSSTSLILVPAAIVLAATAPNLISLLFGDPWRGAVPILQWFCLALASFGALGPFGNYMMSQGRSGALRNWGVADFVIRGGGALIGASFSPAGAAAGFGLTSFFIMAPASLWVSGMNEPVTRREQVRAVFSATPVIMAVCAVALACRWALDHSRKGDDVFSLVIIAGACAITWLLVALLFSRTRVLVLNLMREAITD
jgi:PST family polysaccharide transporter